VPMNWKLNKIQYPVYNLGDGKRIGIWVQGCEFYCKSCINSEIWSLEKGEDISLQYLFNWVLLKAEAFDGITITGGEPFRQYEKLIAFLHLIKSKTKLTVNCYTGYYLHELYTKFPDKLFAKYIDYLIDGRYEEKHQVNDNTKGSSNQTIYKFCNGIPFVVESIKFSNKWSLKVCNDSSFYLSGIPKQGEMKQLMSELFEGEIVKSTE